MDKYQLYPETKEKVVVWQCVADHTSLPAQETTEPPSAPLSNSTPMNVFVVLLLPVLCYMYAHLRTAIQ